MIAITDTSPLNYLTLLGYAELLPRLFGKVFAPHAVIAELSHPGTPPAVRALAASLPAWLEIVDVGSIDQTLALNLGAGEREAITLGMRRPASLLIIDDYAGRAAAQARNVPITGTLALLVKAALLGQLDL